MPTDQSTLPICPTCRWEASSVEYETKAGRYKAHYRCRPCGRLWSENITQDAIIAQQKAMEAAASAWLEGHANGN